MTKKQPQMYFSGFSLENPPSASNSKRVRAAYEAWKQTKLAQREQAAESERVGNTYETKARTGAVVTEGNRGTGSFTPAPTPTQPQPQPQAPAQSKDQTLDKWIAAASSADFIKRVQSDSDFRSYVNGAA